MKTIRETSDFVCKKLLNKLSIKSGSTILEPSCGEGKIIDYLLKTNIEVKNLNIFCIELNKEKITTAINNFSNIINHKFHFLQKDFLNHRDHNDFFDLIIACPPFKNNIDLDHIQAMYRCLKPNGLMVTLTSPYWITNNESHQVDFRKWLSNKYYNLEILPDNSFIEKNKTIPTAILSICK